MDKYYKVKWVKQSVNDVITESSVKLLDVRKGNKRY